MRAPSSPLSGLFRRLGALPPSARDSLLRRARADIADLSAVEELEDKLRALQYPSLPRPPVTPGATPQGGVRTIAELFEFSGLTQAEVGQRGGLHPNAATRLCHSDDMFASSLYKLAKGLGATLAVTARFPGRGEFMVQTAPAAAQEARASHRAHKNPRDMSRLAVQFKGLGPGGRSAAAERLEKMVDVAERAETLRASLREMEARRNVARAEGKTMNQIRIALGLRLREVAAPLGVDRTAVQYAFREQDSLFSTLTRYVTAMGGTLHASMTFPGGEVFEVGGLRSPEEVMRQHRARKTPSARAAPVAE
jgi:transcriptional regulator with XRE-family HTH domain